MIKNAKNRLIALICCSAFSLLAACGGGGGASGGASSGGVVITEKGEVEVFSANITDKILQDYKVSNDEKLPAEISVIAGKGESEAAQIIMTATKTVSAYDFKVSQLTNESGDVLSVDNIEVFNQKYIEIKSNSSTGGGESGPLGWYPDILLPFEKAIEYKENTVKKGENQGIVVQINVPFDQNPGTYTGNFVLTVDGENQNIPAEVKVYDIVYPEVTTFDSLYLVDRADLIYGEGDNSIEMYAKYCDKLIEYKTMPFLLPASSGDFKGYAEQVRKYYGKISGYSIPWAYKNDRVDMDVLYNYVIEIVNFALEDGINYLSKARNYYPLIDEPLGQGRVTLANAVCKEYYEGLKVLGDKIRALETPDHATCTKEEIAASIVDMKNIVTAHLDPSLPEVKHFCPGFSDLDTEVKRQNYFDMAADDIEYWWYGCNQPVSPYPNFHTDDMNNMTATRVMGMMSEIYGVQGELYWETVLYRETSFAGGYFHKINTDVYESAMQYPGTNGDGVLFYPGSRYGVDGPIVSNRLLAIRDAREEYDLLGLLSAAYAEKGLDYSSVIELLGRYLYNGSKVQADSSTLFAVREQIFELLSLAKNEGVYVTDVCDTQTGFTFNVVAEDGKKVTYNGTELTNKTENGYVCKIDLTANDNTFNVASGKHAFSFNLRGKKSVIYTPGGVSTIAFTAMSEGDLIEVVEGSAIGQAGSVAKVSFNEGSAHAFKVAASDSSMSLISKNTKDFAIKIYNPTEQKFTLGIRMNSVTGTNFPYTDVIVKANGITEIRLGDLGSIKWQLHKKISSIDFALNVPDGVTAETLYIVSATATEVK